MQTNVNKLSESDDCKTHFPECAEENRHWRFFELSKYGNCGSRAASDYDFSKTLPRIFVLDACRAPTMTKY